MKTRGPLLSFPFDSLVSKFIDNKMLERWGAGLFRKARPPRPPIPKISAFQAGLTREDLAKILAAIEVAQGRATDPAAEAERIKQAWGPNVPDQDHTTIGGSHKKVKQPLNKQRKTRKLKRATDKPKTADQWLQQAARVLTERRIANGEQIDFQRNYEQSLSELRAGFFNPQHWKECDVISTDHLQNEPTTSTDTKPRSYAYPDPKNKRTLATYAQGTPSDGPPRYNGNSANGQFRDHLLVWSRTKYDLVNKIEPGAVEPTFIDIQGKIRAFANRRGSRPMLSYIAKTWLTAKGSDLLDTTWPPTIKSWSFYYRYKVPNSAPPYYASEDVKRGIRTMCQPAHMEAGATLEQAVVLLAPRPMYGRGFNNNTDVTTQLIVDAKLWQIDLTPRDYPANHVWFWCASWHFGVTWEQRASGGQDEINIHVRTEPCSYAFIELIINLLNRERPRDVDKAIALCTQATNGTPGFAFDIKTRAGKPAHDCDSGWIPYGPGTFSAYLSSQNMDTNNDTVVLGFIYDELRGTVEVCGAGEFFLTATDQINFTNLSIDKYARPGATLYVQGIQYRVIPP